MRGRGSWLLAGAALFGAGCNGKSPAPPPQAEQTPAASPAPAEAPKVAAQVAHPRAPRPAQLALWPMKGAIGGDDSGIQFALEGRDARAGEPGLMAQARWSIESPESAKIGADGYLVPLKSGTAKVIATVGEDRAEAEVVIADLSERPWNFATDIAPRLTRAGCNIGGCHAKQDGQNGFHLSLFGYDTEGDFRALTREAGGRRLSRVAPEESLFLLKALGRLPHGGGRRIDPGSEDHKILAAWLKAGAPEVRGKAHGKLTKITVEPGDVRLREPGDLQLRVVAHYADGHRRDVTRLAAYRSNDDSTLAIDPNGKASLLRRAEADLVVRYQSHIVAIRLATVVNPDLAFDFAKLPRRNLIDEQLFRRLESLKVPPSPPADDASFLRRASLDLVGQQPTPATVRDYLADTNPDKKAELVDRLLKSPEFRKFWKIKLGDWLQIAQSRFPNTAGAYESWLDRKLIEGAPLDAMAKELLTTLGNPARFDNGAANYALDGPDPKTKAERTAQRFLGLRIRCAQCHDHPFDIWTQDDYHGFAAIFAKAGPYAGGDTQGGDAMMMSRIDIAVNPKAQLEHTRTRQPAAPRLLDGTAVAVGDGEDPRTALAAWLINPENRYFARAVANWAWAQFFAKGIADPPDDLSAANPPVHPELLDALAQSFIDQKYDLKALVRLIALSEAYGLSSATIPENERDHRLFSHQTLRPLTAHQMADALALATGVPNRFAQGETQRTDRRRAIDVFDPSVPSEILDTFGRCPRTNGCGAVPTPSLSLRQALLVIGGTVIEDKVAAINGYIAEALELQPTPAELVENLYFRTLCRPPTAEEVSHWSALLQGAPNLREAAEDLFWALLNSREFAFNH